MAWLFSFSPRTYRIAAVVIALAGIPTAVTQGILAGAWMAIFVFAAHLYLAACVAFMFPWLLPRIRARRGLPER